MILKRGAPFGALRSGINSPLARQNWSPKIPLVLFSKLGFTKHTRQCQPQ